MDSTRYTTFAIFFVLCAGLGFIFRNEITQILNAPPRAQPAGPSVAVSKPPPPPEALRRIFETLRIEPLNAQLVSVPTISTALKDLQESPCDKTAIFRLSNGLFDQGEKRAASQVLAGFAGACPNADGELNAAANILFGIGDYAGVVPLADKLIATRPEVSQLYYMRGQALSFLGRPAEAIDDFQSAIGLFDDLRQVSSEAFAKLAAAYSATGKHCQAMTTVQTYLTADPAKNDNAATRRLISEYAGKGGCNTGYAEGVHVIARTKKDVIIASVSVNGVKGNFIVDTGASVVAIDKAFAARAKIGLENTRTVMMHTANGTSLANLTTIDRVELGKVSAEKVSAAVIEKPLGAGIDGLLGMSFLARFQVSLNDKELRVEAVARQADVPPAAR